MYPPGVFSYIYIENNVEWKYLAISMTSVATAMLCKEQGITVTAICAVYEIFVVQKVSSFLSYFIYLFLFFLVGSHLSHHIIFHKKREKRQKECLTNNNRMPKHKQWK